MGRDPERTTKKGKFKTIMNNVVKVKEGGKVFSAK
jgi:hypothetical protein